MATSDLYASALASLTSARSLMISAAWQAELDLAAPPVRVEAGNALMHLQGAILALSNTTLSDIAADMQANASGLKSCISGLTQALGDITQTQNILNNVTSFLTLVGKIVPLV